MTSAIAVVTRLRCTAGFLAAALLAVLSLAAPVHAAEQAPAKPPVADLEAEAPVAPVIIDGITLFRVRGITSFPATERAAAIAGRIEVLAADKAFRSDELQVLEAELGTEIRTASGRVMLVLDADGKVEGLSRRELAAAFRGRIVKAIEACRAARTPEALAAAATRAGIATGVLVLIVGVVFWTWRRVEAAVERRFRQRVHSVGIQSFQIVRAERIWGTLQGVLGTARAVALLVAAFVYLQYVLGLFPQTQAVAARLLEYVLDPLAYLGRGALDIIPNLLFLTILYFVTSYLLKLIHLFFASVGRGEVKLSGFEAEWADPTYKLVRVMAVILALVVAYPYIPGSGSEAFKGLSIFVGVVFSLGSSSAIANMVAGYLMTYRRAFKIGDRVKIQGIVGDVTETRLQVTHLRTVKNEEVVIPNSSILNNEVVNYSALARTEGLILHTTVGIGYETPWRQVEAMLLMAAGRTAGLRQEPAPFVRQQGLGDFAITYELNVFCDNAQAMGAIYTDLHRSVLDVFNEYGVQIMTPAYEGDPAEPKVVPKERWYIAPAGGKVPTSA